jgi:nucleolar protein 14
MPAGSLRASEAQDDSDEFKLGLLSIALSSISLAMDIEASGSSKESYPEVAEEAQAALLLLKGFHLPPGLELHRSEILDKINQVSMETVNERCPLSRPASSSRAPGSVSQINREFNPRFEDGYVKGRDYDPDRERALDRKGKRTAAKEKRGKMREMRKDSLFLSDQRDKEKAQVDKERMESQRSFYSILEKQAGDLKSGGQGGGVKRKRK